MEFPDTGVQCSVKDCMQLDFLPVSCNYCSNVFCKVHFHVNSHSCSKFIDNIAVEVKKVPGIKCFEKSCSERSVVEMPCVECQQHFCLSHRYHGCLEQTEEEKSKGLMKLDKTKQDFLEAKNAIDREVTSKLLKSKNSSMANKLQLMKLKGSAIGPNNIPAVKRRYFSIHLPITNSMNVSKEVKGVFVSIDWSIGRAIDSISDTLNIPNLNNVSNAKKLRIFDYTTGNIVTDQMDLTMLELLHSNNLVEGQHIILEYSSCDKIDCSLYKQ